MPDSAYEGEPGGPSDPATPGPYCLARCYCGTCPQYRQQHDDQARATEHAARQRLAREGQEASGRGRSRLRRPAKAPASLPERTGRPDPAGHPGPPPSHTRAALDSPRADVGLQHPPESHAAAAGALGRSRTLRAQVLALVAARREHGATSDEVEQHTGRAHQTVSACLYGLEQDGLAARIGPVRPTRQHTDARAYVVTPHGTAELRRVQQPHPGQW